MTKRVDWKNKTNWETAARGRTRADLRGIVRFLARRAAERTYRALKSERAASQPTKGDRP